MPTTIFFEAGLKVEVTADVQRVRDALTAERWSQFEGRDHGRELHINRETVAYIEEAAAREMPTF